MELRRMLLALLLWAPCAPCAAEPVSDSLGRWGGVVAERTAAWPGDGRVELRVEGTAERFTINLAGPAGPLLAGEFRGGERKDVYGPPAAKGLMSFLGRDSSVNPIDGKPLAWVRRDGGTLVVYRIDVADGAYRLDRAVLAPAAGGMKLAFERREHGKAPQGFTAALQRSKP